MLLFCRVLAVGVSRTSSNWRSPERYCRERWKMSRGLLSRAWIAALKTLCARFPFSHGQFLASDTGKGPDSGKIDLVFATFARRNNVSDNCQCERDQSSTSQPLDGARPDQRKRAGGQGASDRP